MQYNTVNPRFLGIIFLRRNFFMTSSTKNTQSNNLSTLGWVDIRTADEKLFLDSVDSLIKERRPDLKNSVEVKNWIKWVFKKYFRENETNADYDTDYQSIYCKELIDDLLEDGNKEVFLKEFEEEIQQRIDDGTLRRFR